MTGLSGAGAPPPPGGSSSAGGPAGPGDGAGRPPRSASRRTLVTVIDQGFASVSNFIVGVAVARIAGPAGLGGFSLAYACWLVLAAQHRSLITDPMAIENDAVRPDALDKLRAGIAAELLVGTATAVALLPVGVVLLAAGQHTFGLSLVAVAPWFPVLALQDYWRWIGFMHRRPGKALANDTVYNCVQATGFALVAVSGVHSVAAVIGSWGIGAAAGAVFGLRQFSVRPSVRGGMALLRERWHMSKWLAGNSLTGWGSTQAGWFLSTFILGATGLGGLPPASQHAAALASDALQQLITRLLPV